MARCFLEGNEAIALGAMAAGCRFYAGYPITPATTIYNHMLRYLPPVGGICMQGEDEIASLGFCLGASMAGMKAMTATSGPGLSLYSEQISFAIGSEIPVVIVDVQRLGPSTGSATKGADGDIQFMRWGNSGGIPIIALAPVDVQDCFSLTVQAFNLAETFRCPVFLAANKEISMTRESVDLEKIAAPEPVNRRAAAVHGPFLPFQADNDRSAPPFLPIGGDVPVRQTSSTHGPDGYITADPALISENQERLCRKISSAAERIALYEVVAAAGAETLIITYGVSARAAGQVAEQFSREGRPVSLLVLKTVWPVPEAVIRETARTHSRIIVVEMNLGQYVREIRRILPNRKIEFCGRMDGDLIPPRMIQEVLENE
jgi:2-oxoglutarate ferredoxin oxidoreductase subunit alpha